MSLNVGRIRGTVSKLMPKYFFNAYGAADSLIAKDRAMVRDVVIALIETNG